MTTPPKVTAIVPTYNYGRFVCDAIDSVLAQTYRDFEIIVVDDGSTDDTRERVGRYGDRVNYIHQENQGQAVAYNVAIRAAKGEYVAFLDADDTWMPDKLEAQLRFAEDAGLDVVVCPMPIGPVSPSERGRRGRRHFEELFFNSPAVGSSALVRRACFDKIGLFDETLRRCKDWDIILRLGREYPIGELHGGYYCLREHSARSSKNAEAMCRHLRIVQRKAFGWPEMRHRWLLKAKIRSFFCYYASCAYLEDAGDRRKAFWYLLGSLGWYPFPVGQTFAYSRMGRLKRLFRIVAGERLFGALRRGRGSASTAGG